MRGRNGASVGEIGLFAAIPQFRLRFPMLGDRLVPYALAGVGFATSEFNDRKRRGIGRAIDVQNTAPEWSLGGGVEFFHTANLDSFVVGGTLRAYLADGARPLPASGSRSIGRIKAQFTERPFSVPPALPHGFFPGTARTTSVSPNRPR